MKLSIIIPTLNEEKYLPRLLQSIKEQNFSDYEVIVSDAVSDDRTQEVAKEWGAKVVTDARRHPSYQRNTGALAAQGEILLFLDADTVLPADFLSTCLVEFEERHLDGAGFYLRFNSPKKFYLIYHLIYNGVSRIAQYFKPVVVGAGIMVKKTMHESLHGFDETIFIGEDHDYCERILKLGKFRLISSRPIYFSVRRMEKEGKIKMLLKWLYGTVYVLLKGPIRKKIMKYDFGNHR
ncbi:MAG TPA: glycosyltransferase [bacterium]|nr:glycosyltransferase [bacterium]HPT29544.1 glycosyltransferase [bacterium]